MSRLYWAIRSLSLWQRLTFLLYCCGLGMLLCLLCWNSHVVPVQAFRFNSMNRSDALLPAFWSYSTRVRATEQTAPDGVQAAWRRLGADGTVTFTSSAGILSHFSRQLSAGSDTQADIGSLLSGVRRMQFLNCDFTTADWSLLSKLSDLEVVEFFNVKGTAEESGELHLRSSATALSKLPRLQTLLLSGDSFPGVGRMPELRTLGLESGQVESFLAGDVSGCFPRLETLLIRIPSDGEVSVGVYARLREISQIRAVHLWSGDAGSAGRLTIYVDEFRRQLPGLSVQRRDWGLSVPRALSLAAQSYFLCIFLLVSGSAAVSLFWGPANVVVPGLRRAHHKLLVLIYVLAALGGVELWLWFGVRVWIPVLCPLLFLAYFVNYSARVAVAGQPRIPVVLLCFMVLMRAIADQPAWLCSVLHGDDMLVNIVLFVAVVLLAARGFWQCNGLSIGVAELGARAREGLPTAAAFGSSVDLRLRWELQSGDFADRLRVALPKLSSAMDSMWLWGLALWVSAVGVAFDWSAVWGLSLRMVPLMLAMRVFLATLPWLGRVDRLGADLLFPCSRGDLWHAVSCALYRDLRGDWLIALGVGAVLLSYEACGASSIDFAGRLSVILLFVSGFAGLCLLHHGLLAVSALRWLGIVSVAIPVLMVGQCVLGYAALESGVVGLVGLAVSSAIWLIAGVWLQWQRAEIQSRIEL
ncbi:MAG: hypothetical protein ACK5A1_14375 [Planctomyces sp.]